MPEMWDYMRSTVDYRSVCQSCSLRICFHGQTSLRCLVKAGEKRLYWEFFLRLDCYWWKSMSTGQLENWCWILRQYFYTSCIEHHIYWSAMASIELILWSSLWLVWDMLIQPKHADTDMWYLQTYSSRKPEFPTVYIIGWLGDIYSWWNICITQTIWLKLKKEQVWGSLLSS